MAFSLGGSKSKSKSSYKDNVWEPQGDALQGMYGDMSNLWGGMNPMFQQMYGQAEGLAPWMQDTMSGAQGGYEELLGGGSYGDTSDVRSQLLASLDKSSGGSNMGDMYSSIVGGEGNDYIDPMVASMRESGMENLDTMKNYGAMDAGQMGQGGSSRHAMSDAMLNRTAGNDMMNREMGMRGDAYDKDLAMKMGIAQQADTNMGSSQDRLLQMLQGADANKQAGMSYGGQMQNLGMGSMAPWMQAMQQPWNMMNQYSQNMGDPTVLGSGSSKGSSASLSGSYGGK